MDVLRGMMAMSQVSSLICMMMRNLCCGGECRRHGLVTVRFQKMLMTARSLRLEVWKVVPLGDAAGLHRRMTRPQAAEMKRCIGVFVSKWGKRRRGPEQPKGMGVRAGTPRGGHLRN